MPWPIRSGPASPAPWSSWNSQSGRCAGRLELYIRRATACGRCSGCSTRRPVHGNRQRLAAAHAVGSDFPKRQDPLLHLVRQHLCMSRGPSGLPDVGNRPSVDQLITTPPGGNPTGKCNEAGKAPCKDGLVTHPESLLPTTYAMELGIMPTITIRCAWAITRFPISMARVQELSNEQPGVTRVGTGGFGDQHNTWAWSMAWFNDMLYVGTGRETNCVTSATSAIQLQTPSLYPPESAIARQTITICRCRPRSGNTIRRRISGPMCSNRRTH